MHETNDFRFGSAHHRIDRSIDVDPSFSLYLHFSSVCNAFTVGNKWYGDCDQRNSKTIFYWGEPPQFPSWFFSSNLIARFDEVHVQLHECSWLIFEQNFLRFLFDSLSWIGLSHLVIMGWWYQVIIGWQGKESLANIWRQLVPPIPSYRTSSRTFELHGGVCSRGINNFLRWRSSRLIVSLLFSSGFSIET